MSEDPYLLLSAFLDRLPYFHNLQCLRLQELNLKWSHIDSLPRLKRLEVHGGNFLADIQHCPKHLIHRLAVDDFWVADIGSQPNLFGRWMRLLNPSTLRSIFVGCEIADLDAVFPLVTDITLTPLQKISMKQITEFLSVFPALTSFHTQVLFMVFDEPPPTTPHLILPSLSTLTLTSINTPFELLRYVALPRLTHLKVPLCMLDTFVDGMPSMCMSVAATITRLHIRLLLEMFLDDIPYDKLRTIITSFSALEILDMELVCSFKDTNAIHLNPLLADLFIGLPNLPHLPLALERMALHCTFSNSRDTDIYPRGEHHSAGETGSLLADARRELSQRCPSLRDVFIDGALFGYWWRAASSGIECEDFIDNSADSQNGKALQELRERSWAANGRVYYE
ncbi:hypothetical protein MIND_01289400 [Mycena indigotica]|uniref:Uncharacterized protein n=1 Tax=Mycena indigotica TaxID=2126181 RepID=A0A8H6S329_9AGAR|nr:uncharacterized protein MIND_01289400 [Mycena indigotica]KAF7291443.1 hypothetical protein MIND_01289400 [Mycena indigotica]